MKQFPLIVLFCLALFTAACQPPADLPTMTPAPATIAASPVAITPSPAETPTPSSQPKIDIQATVAALAASIPTPQGSAVTPIAADDYVGIFERAWELVRDNYVRDNFNGVDWDAVREEYLPRVQAVQSQAEFWDVMHAFIAELGDDHSRFVRPGDFAGEFGIVTAGQSGGQGWPGMTVWPAREDPNLIIWDVCERGPAASVGLERGDHILAINGQPVERSADGWDDAAIQASIYDGDGAVQLTVQQGADEEPRDVTVRYGGASGCDGWSYGLVSDDPKIGYIRIAEFGGDADTNVLDMINDLEADGPLDGLILDVRHNPGGNSDRTIAIFTEGTFGEDGALREGEMRTIWRVRGPVKWNETTPVVLLTDGASHSAAEYFATAMQQSGRATLVGMPTAGNTEGISGFSLPDGSLIRLAITTLTLPDGNTLEGTGVIPDITVPLGDWGLRADADPQLFEAYQTLLDRIGLSS